MAVEQAITRLSAVGVSGLIGVSLGVAVPGVLQAANLFGAIRDRKQRRDAQELCRCAAAEIEVLRASEYRREPAASVFASALATCTETLERHRLSSAEFLRLGLEPERAASEVLAHAPFNRLDGDDIPGAARRILACFYAKVRAERDLLREILPDVYGMIVAIDAAHRRIEDKQDETLAEVRTLADKSPVIDVALVRLVAEQQGYLSPEKAKGLEEQVARTQADLERIRAVDPDWRAEVDAAIEAFNRSDMVGAKAAFARIDVLIAERRAELTAQERELRLEEARSKHAQATLFYPFEASRSEPLLAQAAELAETNIWYWIECGLARIEIGNLERAGAAFETARGLAEASGSRRDVAAALVFLGDVRVAQGELPGALEAYDESLRIFRDLAARDPGHAGWARDVSVSLVKVGDVRVAQGDLPAALVAFEESLRIRRDLAARDPGNAGWARDVSVSLDKVGDVRVAQGELPAALVAFEEGLEIARDLASRDPGNAGWARDVSVSLERIGDVRVAQGDLSRALQAYEEGLTIRRDLASRDPGNAGWARDVSLSLTRIGDVRRAQGDLPAALVAYEEGLQIAHDLASRDPGNAGWARDVSVSLNKVGDVRVAQGDLPAALVAFEESLRIRRDLASRDPGNADWARDVWVSLWRMAGVDSGKAASYWEEVVARIEDMQARGILLPTDAPYLDAARENLERTRK